jgi:hypothetical protein
MQAWQGVNAGHCDSKLHQRPYRLFKNYCILETPKYQAPNNKSQIISKSQAPMFQTGNDIRGLSGFPEKKSRPGAGFFHFIVTKYQG